MISLGQGEFDYELNLSHWCSNIYTEFQHGMYCINASLSIYIKKRNCGKKIFSDSSDRAEKRLRMHLVDSFWCVFDRLINESLPPWTTNVIVSGDFLAIITFDKMELDEFWEQSNSTSLWHTEHFMHWAVSCTKTNFSEAVHPQNFSKNNFPLLKARLNFYLFTADLVFSL